MEDKEKDCLEYLLSNLDNIIKTAMENSLNTELTNEGNLPYSNPTEYRQITGKRFRIKPAQKEAGLTREQAFEEFLVEKRNELQGN